MDKYTRYILSFCLFCFSFQLINSQTHYYKLSYIKDADTKYPSDQSGIFITFTAKGCYVSDKNGFSDDSGFMKYDCQNEKTISYRGLSHCGQCNFYFDKGYNLLNIVFNNITLVYRKSDPGSITTSTFSQKYTNKKQKNKTIDDNIEKEIRETKQKIFQEELNLYKKEWVKCVDCGGSGRCTSCAGRGFTLTSGTMFECGVCHGGGRCIICHGQGGYKL